MIKPLELQNLPRPMSWNDPEVVRKIASKVDEVIFAINSLQREEKVDDTVGPGGCCKKCVIYLDYKNDYQCSDGECECHKLHNNCVHDTPSTQKNEETVHIPIDKLK